uniref:Selenoprotein F/M domain-containing protein n=2 Tax=Spumella elongata TaxID=89044 RepID=A0A7S3GQR9_9STRA|mmetsp:Transcript_14438/g.25397  ORF Transcript_14438/g.25397 Transcript_14438/m.25397 type:complete len:157 (+) Transcript_14438:14-484(+)
MTIMKGFIYIFALLAALVTAQAFVRDNCPSLGYNPSVLTCDTCDTMHKILDHQTTYDNCKSCCIAKVEEKFSLAVLEVDKRYLSFMKEISAVTEKKSELGLKVRYRYVNPTLYMYKEKGDKEPAETIAVGQWNKATFEDYLSSHLKGKIPPAKSEL